jgi:hypothetical protein
MQIIALEEFADFATLNNEKLFTKLKSHELCRKGRPNHDASLTSKAFVTSWRTEEGDQRGMNESQLKFLDGTQAISQNQPDASLF